MLRRWLFFILLTQGIFFILYNFLHDYHRLRTREGKGSEKEEEEKREEKAALPASKLCSRDHLIFLNESSSSHLRSSDLTILTSYPRSGNSLTRALLEYSTGIYTGSYYLDKHLLANGYRGETVTEKGKVLFFKSHHPSLVEDPLPPFDKVVQLIRNPFEAIWSYFEFLATKNHENMVPMEILEEDGGEKWRNFTKRNIRKWKRHFQFWEDWKASPVLHVKQEDYFVDCEKTLGRILDFAFDGGTPLEFKERIPCACQTVVKEKQGTYKIKKRRDLKQLYSKKQEKFVWNECKKLCCRFDFSDLRGTHTCSKKGDRESTKVQ